MLSKNQIKYINSLKQKKERTETGRFIMEGDKLVSELLEDKSCKIETLVATTEWLNRNLKNLHTGIHEIIEAGESGFSKISSFETPTGVLAIIQIPEFSFDYNAISGSLSLCLDTLQDPGNLGTIIRTADWFGIEDVFCSPGCADCYSPKVVQASMGAVRRVSVQYLELQDFLGHVSQINDFPVYGSFLEGESLYEADLKKNGVILFGNESRGIQSNLLRYISKPLTIPSFSALPGHVESLNVSVAVAVFCSEFSRR
jgi:TrmH family RNA methyltransferase